MRSLNRLTAIKVSKLSVPGKYADGGNLYLQVSSYKTKSWLFRYRTHSMGLGALHTVSLAEARDAARDCRKLVRAGIDPLAAKREKRLQAALEGARGVTFQECAERYIDAHRPSWRNQAHAAQWPTTMAAYVYPTFGHLSVASIDTPLVLQAIERLWTEKPETAGRVRGRIEAVLNWAKAREYRSGDNPARWRGHLENLLPNVSKVRRVEHLAALHYRDVPAFMAELRQQAGIVARCLEFTILTCARTGEAMGATWAEFDFQGKVWTVPRSRMKAERDHRVPMADSVLALLESLPHEEGNAFVFLGSRAKRPLGKNALLDQLKRMGRGGITVHGFRSSFRDWAAEQTNFPREAAEIALAHTVGDDVERAYLRGDMFEKRRRLAAEWSRYCAKIATGSGDNVVKIGRGG